MADASATVTARMVAHTEKAPLIPQSHGVISGARPAASFKPSGNPIPMNRPAGARSRTATSTRTLVVAPSVA
jgi:hypothetical protein